MADKSKIEWTEATWNPITGCTPISEGCEHCYAKRMVETRLRGRCGYDHHDPFKVTFHDSRLDQPLRWVRPRKIFVCSMGDLFHKDVPDAWLSNVFRVIQRTPRHRFMILTKRPERMRDYFRKVLEVRSWSEDDVPFPNVWAGVTAENQKRADERIPILLGTPAAVRFVSVEPILGPVDLWNLTVERPDLTLRPDAGCKETAFGKHMSPNIDWIICGGETGPGARPMHPDWVRSLRDQCQEAEVPFFFKSWGDYIESYEDPAPDPADVVDYERYRVHRSGKRSRMIGAARTSVAEEEKGWAEMVRVGKKAAGRILDGQTWDEEPEVGRQ